MLPAPSRMRRADEFQRTVRRGIRVARPTLVIHAGRGPEPGPARVGFVVSKALGSAVRRNRVKRRLRHLAAERLGQTPSGVEIVVRALPSAASTPTRLPVDFASAWSSALSRLEGR